MTEIMQWTMWVAGGLEAFLAASCTCTCNCVCSCPSGSFTNASNWNDTQHTSGMEFSAEQNGMSTFEAISEWIN